MIGFDFILRGLEKTGGYFTDVSPSLFYFSVYSSSQNIVWGQACN